MINKDGFKIYDDDNTDGFNLNSKTFAALQRLKTEAKNAYNFATLQIAIETALQDM